MNSVLTDAVRLENLLKDKSVFPNIVNATPVNIKTNACGASGGLVKIEGINKADIEDFVNFKSVAESYSASNEKMINQSVLEKFINTEDAALMGIDFFRKYEDKFRYYTSGQTIVLAELGGVSLTFVGVFESENPVFNTTIISGSTFLQQVDNTLGRTNMFYVKIDNPANLDIVSEQIEETVAENFPYRVDVQDSAAYLTQTFEDLNSMVQLSYFIMIITLGVILTAVGNTISMSMRDRIQEIGILRSLGFQKKNISMLVIFESTIISVAGALLGLVALSVLFLSIPFSIAYHGVSINILMTHEVFIAAILMSIIVGLLGGLFPAIGAGKIKIVESLRNVD